MELMTRAELSQYLSGDRVLNLMAEYARAGDSDLICQKWLQTTPAKRLIFERLYGDLLGKLRYDNRRVLDVGGGLTCFTRRIAATHDYQLVDILAHGGCGAAKAMEAELGRPFVFQMDWLAFEPDAPYDVVIANDLFPNVDQRLGLFIRKFLPISNEIRLSLTYSNESRFYATRRVDADEFLYVLAWDGETTARTMTAFRDCIIAPDFSLFSAANASLFSNGRDVVIVRLLGRGRLPSQR